MNKLLIILLFLYGSTLYAQNLVPDSGFEIYKKKYKDRKYKFKTKHWSSPTGTTPDLFSKFNLRESFLVPKNDFGYQFPFDGDTYVGIVVYATDTRYEYREFIETKLTSALIPGNLYCISMYVSLADISMYASDGIDLLLKTKRHNNTRMPIFVNQPTIVNIGGVVVQDTAAWVRISDVFVAEEAYKYLIIGNLRGYDENKIIQVKKYDKKLSSDQEGAYYYIDNVSLIVISDSSECPCYTKPLLAVNDSVTDVVMEEKDSVGHFVLENIYFETDKAILLDSSYKELDAMLEVISTNKSNKIIITGHTDNQGEEKHNQQLSEARAKAVYSYFIEKGIAASRMEYIGYGSTKPISNNNTEEGRRKNRRVEILLE